MPKNKKYEEQILPDDYTDLLDGNAGTDSDAVYGDFVYEQRKVGNKTQNIRRAVVQDQIDPPPYPENTANPYISPEDMEQQNGTIQHKEEDLPPLQQKIDEAEAILAATSNEGKSRDRDRGSERE